MKKGEHLMRKVETEIYTRICGYFRPSNQANPGKIAEIKDRKYYRLKGVFDEKKANME